MNRILVGGERGSGAGVLQEKVPVFGILERGGKVTVEVVTDVQSETLLELAIKKVKRGCLIYTDKFRSYKEPCRLWVQTSENRPWKKVCEWECVNQQYRGFLVLCQRTLVEV